MNNIFYFGKNGCVYDEFDIDRAFYISTGMRKNEHKLEYYEFIHSIVGVSIDAVKSASVEELVERGYTVKAVKLYREKNCCSLAEAKSAVDKIGEKMDGGADDADS
ncbi:MAG: hypothetical protein II642_06080 [Firmicutes bacterium]|nr:hypothetical protein [Bacillota bacterium]